MTSVIWSQTVFWSTRVLTLFTNWAVPARPPGNSLRGRNEKLWEDRVNIKFVRVNWELSKRLGTKTIMIEYSYRQPKSITNKSHWEPQNFVLVSPLLPISVSAKLISRVWLAAITTIWLALESTPTTSNGHRRQLHHLPRPPWPLPHHLLLLPSLMITTATLTMRYISFSLFFLALIVDKI